MPRCNTTLIIEVDSKYNYTSSINEIESTLASTDYLVLTAILILSIGVALGRNLSSKWEKNSRESTPPLEASSDDSTRCQNSLRQAFLTGISNCYAFANVISLFGLSGEVVRHGVGVQYFFAGMLLSLLVISLSGVVPILTSSKIGSLAAYMKERFPQACFARYLCIFASLIRYVATGSLNLHIAGIVTSTMTNVHLGFAEILIGVSAFICVCVGEIQQVPESSISHLWFFILSITTLSTVSVTTVKEIGINELLAKASSIQNITWQSFWTNPVGGNSFWGFLSLGTIFGLQMFVLSPFSLRAASTLSTGYFYFSIVLSSAVIFMWLVLGTWAGVCCKLAFPNYTEEASSEDGSMHPDGSLARLILLQMGSVGGFRGFFVASLLASSISSMTIRCNQVISLIWGFRKDLFPKKPDESMTSPSTSFTSYIMNKKNKFPEELLKEIKRTRHAHRRNQHLVFKVIVGFGFFGLSVGFAYGLQASSASIWEMWHSIVGVTCGSALGALMIGVFLPCLRHKSVVLGLCVGWLISLLLSFIPSFNSNCLASNDTDPPVSESKKGFAIEENLSSLAQAVNDSSCGSQPDQRTLVPYHYFGLVGVIGCIATALFYSALSNSCHKVPYKNPLVHPLLSKSSICSSKPPLAEDEIKPPSLSNPMKAPNDRTKILQVIHESSGM